MKQHIQPSNEEWFLSEDEIIISKTDPKGKVTYANETLVKISGFLEKELIGQPHNIVRHPDMPKGVFQLLWNTVQAHDEFNGYVKNMRKDGGFYWVFANITPSYDVDNNLLGFYSVRRKPSQEAITIIDNLYQEMLAAEKGQENNAAISASQAILNKTIEEKGVSYDEFIFSI